MMVGLGGKRRQIKMMGDDDGGRRENRKKKCRDNVAIVSWIAISHVIS